MPHGSGDESSADAAGNRDDVERESTGSRRAFDAPTTDAPSSAIAFASSPGERAGDSIGPYRLLSVLGEGGFGVVWLAERREPHVQRVALKIIKPGMDSRAVIARFEQERQALAVMDHPNVAKVYDAGATPLGRPYFVMEAVQGEPITAYCDRHSLTITQRLELFIPVCTAVQHAHHKGLIHRDIKPSNVLVAIRDGNPIPKVIDFGVAKAISQTLTEKTIFTEQGQIIGTPEYMSPEQAEMGALDVDTRTDVYSLGVLLYEVLAGVLPFEPQMLRNKAYGEIQRIIREEPTPRPSTKLTGMGEQLVDIARKRQAQRDDLVNQLRKELEWIPLKAMRKDRTERYATPKDLADDIGHYLNGQPLDAGPESTGYRLRKFVRRNRAAVAAVTAVVLALAAGVVGTSLALAKARTAERAEKRRGDELQQVSDFQAEMLRQVDPTAAGQLLSEDVRKRFEAVLAKEGVSDEERALRTRAFAGEWGRINATDAARQLIDRTILEPAVATIDVQFKDQLLVDASLRQVLAELYQRLGSFDAAVPLQQRVVAIRRQLLGDEHVLTLGSIGRLGSLLLAQGKLAHAEPLMREAMDTGRRILGEEHLDTIAAINNMAVMLMHQGKLSQAEPLVVEGLEKNRRVKGEDHPGTISSINNMGGLLKAQGKLREAEPYYEETLAKSRRVLGADHPDTMGSIGALAGLLTDQGRYSEAEKYYRELTERSRRVLGEEHPDTLRSVNDMAGLLQAQGELAEAEELAREVLEKRRRTLGKEHPDTLDSTGLLANLLQDAGTFSEAEKLRLDVLQTQRRVYGDEHPGTLRSMANLGKLLEAQGKRREAAQYFQAVLEVQRRTLGNEHPDTVTTISLLGQSLMDQGKLSDARPYYEEALETYRRTLGEEHPNTLTATTNMGVLLRHTGRLTEAEPFFRSVLEAERRVLGNEHPSTLGALNNLGFLLREQGRLDESETYLREALETRRRVLGNEHPDTLNSINGMGLLLQAQGRLVEAEAHFREAMETRRRILGDEHPNTIASLSDLGGVLRAQNKFEEAERCYRDALEASRRLLGDDHPETITSINNLGALLRSEGKLEEAETYSREALERFRRVAGDRHPHTLASIINLAGVLREQKHFAEAEELLAPAADIADETLPPQSPFRKGVYRALGSLYETWHAAEPDAGYAAKAQQWREKLAALEPATQTATQPAN